MNGTGVLYFSSNRGGSHDIYRSGGFAAPIAVAEINTSFDEFRPNVRKDGREIAFDSNRPGGLGATDISAAVRSSVDESWSAPENLGPHINSRLARAGRPCRGTAQPFCSARASPAERALATSATAPASSWPTSFETIPPRERRRRA